MTIKTLKKHIFENNEIEFVLKNIGCHHIVYHSNKDFYSCANFNGDNVGAINVKNNEYLNVVNWTRQNEFGDCSDIITLTQYNRQCSFMDAVKYLYNLVGLEYKPGKPKTVKKTEGFDPLYIFKRVKIKRRRVDVAELQSIDEDILDEYAPMIHINFFKEGIMPRTRKKFGLCYSYKYKRVVIPHRHWLTGDLVGINQRTMVDNYEELGIRKYHLTEGYAKSSNLYGLYENYEGIKNAGYVTIVESEKSVLKRDSRNDSTCVGLSGKSLSDEQRRIIFGLNVPEVIICLDNDVDINEIRSMCEKFYGFCRVSYIKDKWSLLGDKDSPCDAPNEDYNFLYKRRVVYDKLEHKEYLKSLERK